MASFYMTLPAEEISRQVADLLNKHNQLRKHHNQHTVLSSNAIYFVDVVKGIVVACHAMLRETDQITKLFHLCVDSRFRRQGIARRLVESVLKHVTTPYVYVTIREDNAASIHLYASLGFVLIKKELARNHNVLTFGRQIQDDTTISMVSGEDGYYQPQRQGTPFITARYNTGGKI